MPFGSERHVHKYTKYIKVSQNLQKQWIMWYQCEYNYCKSMGYIKLKHKPLDESRLDKDGNTKPGIWLDEDDNLHIQTS